MLDSAKDPIEKKLLQGVYTIPCSCNKVYIGETSRSITTRLKEHGANIHHYRVKSSAVVEHSYNKKHHICLVKAEVLATIPHHFKRKIREAQEIEKYPNNINSDDSLKLKDSQKPVVKILKNKTKRRKK